MLPLVVLGQSNGAVNLELDAILQPTATIQPNSVVEVQFRNLGSKEITGFRYSRVDLYASGMRITYRRAGGADFVGFAAECAALGRSCHGNRLQPGDTFTLTINQVRAPDGSRMTGVDVAVTALTFADRTALGDPKELRSIFAGRRQDLERVDAGLAEARAFLAGPDPRGAVNARLAKIRQSGAKPASLGFLELLSLQLDNGDPTLVAPLLASWEVRRKALSEHSTMRGGK